MKTKRLIVLIGFVSTLITLSCKIDKVSAQVNDKQSESAQPLHFVAKDKEIGWLKTNCIKIKTVQAESGFEDLQPLKKLIGNARIVALGENTHGTSEVFKIKHRLIEFLASEMNFTILSIELGMPESYEVNEYVLYGKGDPKALLKKFSFWPFNNQEFLDLIEWMRKYNASGKGRVQFTGFDTQHFAGSFEIISKYADKNDKVLKSKIDSIAKIYEDLASKGKQIAESEDELQLFHHICESVLSYLSINKNSISRISCEKEIKWLLCNARIIVQSSNPVGFTDMAYRDKCMAENVEWLLENNLNEKIILWGHIGHLRKELPWLGGYLSKKFGINYYSIGTASNSGNYTAVNSNKLTPTNTLNASEPGSFEFSFHKTGIPIFYFDFNQVTKSEQESLWMTKALNYRGIGSDATEKQFSPVRISEWYNAIIYIDSTHASNCFYTY